MSTLHINSQQCHSFGATTDSTSTSPTSLSSADSSPDSPSSSFPTLEVSPHSESDQIKAQEHTTSATSRESSKIARKESLDEILNKTSGSDHTKVVVNRGNKKKMKEWSAEEVIEWLELHFEKKLVDVLRWRRLKGRELYEFRKPEHVHKVFGNELVTFEEAKKITDLVREEKLQEMDEEKVNMGQLVNYISRYRSKQGILSNVYENAEKLGSEIRRIERSYVKSMQATMEDIKKHIARLETVNNFNVQYSELPYNSDADLQSKLSKISPSAPFRSKKQVFNQVAIQRAKKKISSDIVLMVIGDAKVGKSTFINALLRKPNFLPQDIISCTAVPIEVRYGNKPMIKYLQNGEVVKSQEFDGHSVPFENITVESLKNNQLNNVLIDTVEVFIDHPLLNNGIVLVDAPGLNDKQSLTKSVLEYLNRVDSIINVTSAKSILTTSEVTLISKYLANKVKDSLSVELFHVITHCDGEIAKKENKEKKKREIVETLIPIFPSIAEKQDLVIHCISSTKALDAHINCEPYPEDFVCLEKALVSYITDLVTSRLVTLTKVLDDYSRTIQSYLNHLYFAAFIPGYSTNQLPILNEKLNTVSILLKEWQKYSKEEIKSLAGKGGHIIEQFWEDVMFMFSPEEKANCVCVPKFQPFNFTEYSFTPDFERVELKRMIDKLHELYRRGKKIFSSPKLSQMRKILACYNMGIEKTPQISPVTSQKSKGYFLSYTNNVLKEWSIEQWSRKPVALAIQLTLLVPSTFQKMEEQLTIGKEKIFAALCEDNKQHTLHQFETQMKLFCHYRRDILSSIKNHRNLMTLLKKKLSSKERNFDDVLNQYANTERTLKEIGVTVHELKIAFGLAMSFACSSFALIEHDEDDIKLVYPLNPHCFLKLSQLSSFVNEIVWFKPKKTQKKHEQITYSTIEKYLERNSQFLMKDDLAIEIEYLEQEILDQDDMKRIIAARKLYITKSHLKIIRGLQVFSRLSHLVLERNNLKQIPQLDELKYLTHLSLRGNQIEEITSLPLLEELKVVDLSCNAIRSIKWKVFQNCHNIRKLYLSQNSIMKINPVSPGILKMLEELHLDRNMIHIMKTNFFSNLKWIRHLNLSDNSLNCIPYGLMDPLIHLQYLNLSYNLLTEFTHTNIFNNQELISLDLSFNRISNLSPSFLYNQSSTIKHLKVSGNKLSMENIQNILEKHVSLQMTYLPQFGMHSGNQAVSENNIIGYMWKTCDPVTASNVSETEIIEVVCGIPHIDAEALKIIDLWFETKDILSLIRLYGPKEFTDEIIVKNDNQKIAFEILEMTDYKSLSEEAKQVYDNIRIKLLSSLLRNKANLLVNTYKAAILLGLDSKLTNYLKSTLKYIQL